MNNIDLDINTLLEMIVKKLKESSQPIDDTKSNIDMDMLTPQQVCDIYPCFNDGTLRKATKNQLPFRKIGKHRFYSAKEIDEWLNKQIIIEGK